MMELLKVTRADGINGDTYPWIPESYYTVSKAMGRPAALEPELGGVEYDGSLQNAWLNWHTSIRAGAPNTLDEPPALACHMPPPCPLSASTSPLIEPLHMRQVSWGYWTYPAGPPLVARWKWFETRHMTHVCDRWQTHRTDNLQAAWFNGVGFAAVAAVAAICLLLAARCLTARCLLAICLTAT